ncbi:MAG TPA: ammonium transporter, partial [archaeon]|nr:ammonium transporter [archaeon]
MFKVLEKTIGLRVTPDVEIEGLDVPELGALAYPEHALIHSHSSGGGFLGDPIAKPEAHFAAAKKPQTA